MIKVGTRVFNKYTGVSGIVVDITDVAILVEFVIGAPVWCCWDFVEVKP